MMFDKIANEIRSDVHKNKRDLKGTNKIGGPLQEGSKSKYKQLSENTAKIYKR